jgi:predicted DNA-binding transcriptional regulator AlpA
MPEAPNVEFLTKAELAKLCRCSERTIDRLLEEGDAPPVTKLSTRRIIFPATSARNWLASRTIRHRDSGPVASKRLESE